ncbi:hypothetical protein NMY22_g11008 [Coprinellus aureogranulatus]|nr:hypothetical protein NMY22_g11008 [Coprinellus aureogranulatus]
MALWDGGRHIRFLLICWGLVAPTLVLGHVAAWHKGMYCLNGTVPGKNNQNTNEIVRPLYQLHREDWWMHHFDRCDEFPPDHGDFLELPSGGSFIVELAANRAFTSLSNGGRRVNTYTDGQPHPGLGYTDDGKEPPEGCITHPNIHTHNEQDAAGTVFAISYNSDIKRVTDDNLVVSRTPWRRIAEYQVPNLPACPPGGCHCVWGWVPSGCGEPNMYMEPFRCRVVGNTGSRAVAPGRPPVWCEDDPRRCVAGAKQMVFWNQLDGNNVFVSGTDLSGRNRYPSYNNKMGFYPGPQNDIFMRDGTARPVYVRPGPAQPIRVTAINASNDVAESSQSQRLEEPTSALATIFVSCIALFSGLLF